MACAGQLGAKTVWVVNNHTIQSLFLSGLASNGCAVAITLILSPVPRAPAPNGNSSIDWPLKFQYELKAPFPPPKLELDLLVDEPLGGQAFEVPIDRLLADDDLRRYANLSPDAINAIAKNKDWIRLFIAEFPLKNPPDFPRLAELQDWKRFGAPLGFALVGLTNIVAAFGSDRQLSDAHLASLTASLDPQSPMSATYPWFPEPDRSQDKLSNTAVNSPTAPNKLIFIRTVPPGQTSAVARVLPTDNEWAVRIGPFRQVQPATSRVAFIHGRTNNFRVEDLPKALPDPKGLAKWQQDIARVENGLKEITATNETGHGQYFWLPEVVTPNAKAVRAIEGSPFNGGVAASFDTNHFHYDATYKLRSIAGKIGVQYDSEHGFGGHAELNVVDWPRTGDQLTVTATNAQRDLEGSLDYKFPYLRSLDRLTTYQLDAVGDAGDDSHFRLGSLSQTPFERRHESGGVKHEIQHKGGDWDVSIVDSIMWEADALRLGLPGVRRDAGLLLRDQQSWQFTPKASNSMQWNYGVAPSFAYGPDIGWRAPFVMGEIQAGARVFFGGEHLDQMYVSLRGSFGSSSSELPPALLYRFGDVDRLYGLEAGEFSGRSYVHGELAYGYSLSPLLANLFKSDGGSAAPPALAGLGLEAIAEIGSISTNSAFRSVTAPDKVVSSYGIALTKVDPAISGAGLRLGYAWSPEGIHSHGRVFAALNWSF